MKIDKDMILRRICYTDLVYDRIRKKLSMDLSNNQIEEFMRLLIEEVPRESMEKRGKNYYIYNRDKSIRITINSNTIRVITVDRLL